MVVEVSVVVAATQVFMTMSSFEQQRSAHGPNTSRTSTPRKIVYAGLAVVLIFIIYSTKFLFEERFAARQDIVIERTGRNRSRRREKADAIKAAQQNLRSAEGDTSLSEGEDSIFQFDLTNIDGKDINIGDTFKGKYKLMLIVNVASKGDKTSRNYAQLQTLYQKYHPLGLEIVAVPCDQFKHQEPGSNKEIERFAREEMHADFPVMGKVEVNGPRASALFRYLRSSTMNEKPVRGNFAKFLVDASGVPLLAYDSKMDPVMMEGQIKLLLNVVDKKEPHTNEKSSG